MDRDNHFFQFNTQAGEPVQTGDVILTPESQALVVNGPFGKFIWNRPTAVIVQRGETVERLPVVDVTRWAILGLAGGAILFNLVFFLFSIIRRRKDND